MYYFLQAIHDLLIKFPAQTNEEPSSVSDIYYFLQAIHDLLISFPAQTNDELRKELASASARVDTSEMRMESSGKSSMS